MVARVARTVSVAMVRRLRLISSLVACQSRHHSARRSEVGAEAVYRGALALTRS